MFSQVCVHEEHNEVSVDELYDEDSYQHSGCFLGLCGVTHELDHVDDEQSEQEVHEDYRLTSQLGHEVR